MVTVILLVPLMLNIGMPLLLNDDGAVDDCGCGGNDAGVCSGAN